MNSTRPTNILLVEDEETLRWALQTLLEKAGRSVTAVSNGREASQALKKTHFDLVITDIVMPEKDGIELIMELRAIQPPVRTIAISGAPSDGKNYLHIASLLGAGKVLSKPFLPEQLLDAVTTTLDE